jgi:hypothetical protein
MRAVRPGSGNELYEFAFDRLVTEERGGAIVVWSAKSRRR